MSQTLRKILLGIGAVALTTQAASAQIPPATDAQKAAGARVESVRFEPSELTLMRGETASLTVVFLDSMGNPIEDVVGLLVSRGGITPRFATLQAEATQLTGSSAGDAQIRVLVVVPEGEGSFSGANGIRPAGTLEASVAERPADRIEVDEPAYTAFSGTSFRMSGTVITDDGQPHGTATPEWRSADPAVATITPGGIASFVRAGAVTFTAAAAGVSADYPVEVMENRVEQLDISPRSISTRTGDVVRFNVRALDGNGRVVENIAMSYSTFGLDSSGAQMYEDGAFVADNPGAYRVVVTMGNQAADAIVEVTAREPASEVELQGRGAVAHVATSDLWVFEGRDGRDYVYTGTHANGGGERMFVWDVTDPTDIVLTDSVVVDARVVNDVKVSADASWAIITREGASDRANGIVVLDLTDPAHPTVISELTDQLTAGIHNVWINGDIVYAVNDGTNAINIIDMSDPASPTHAGMWELRPGETNKSLHDVWSDGDYAYVSYWDDGLVILDVGAGTHGGTPTEPVFVSSINYAQGNTHVAWREGDYVFLGDEIGTADGMRGYVHVVDVSDIDHPEEVAKYEVPEAGAHNLWVEDGTMYIAYYQGGLRIVDVSGELRGDLYRQGREIGFIRTNGAEGEAIVPNSAMAWGPQPHKGNIFLSDMNSGLWVLKHQRSRVITP
ncbi:MAG: hypothetical protein O7I93_00400 [Gemmatimonadetes bacterium]|nr:hypothetical protein [Gemmatimonadota bacterium]